MSFSMAILAALLGAVTTAGAGYYNDGNAILLDCTARDETLTTCLGYLDGIADAMQGNWYQWVCRVHPGGCGQWSVEGCCKPIPAE